MNPATERDTSDLGLVSGFYGPGTYTGWLLALTSSWLTLSLGRESSGTAELLPHLLYVNCAAIDTLRRLIEFQRSKSGPLNPFIAAFGVTTWGLMHNHVQIYVCRELSNRAAYRRIIYLVLGSIIPQAASISMIVGFFLSMEGLWSQTDSGSFAVLQVVLLLAAISLHALVLMAALRIFYTKDGRFCLNMLGGHADWLFYLTAFTWNLNTIFLFGSTLRSPQWYCLVVPCAS